MHFQLLHRLLLSAVLRWNVALVVERVVCWANKFFLDWVGLIYFCLVADPKLPEEVFFHVTSKQKEKKNWVAWDKKKEIESNNCCKSSTIIHAIILVRPIRYSNLSFGAINDENLESVKYLLLLNRYRLQIILSPDVLYCILSWKLHCCLVT